MNAKTALVTGGSAGIGKAIAFALAREGVDVAICARRKEPLEAETSQIARETNRKIVAIPADLTKPAMLRLLSTKHSPRWEQHRIGTRRSSRFSHRRALGTVVAA